MTLELLVQAFNDNNVPAQMIGIDEISVSGNNLHVKSRLVWTTKWLARFKDPQDLIHIMNQELHLKLPDSEQKAIRLEYERLARHQRRAEEDMNININSLKSKYA